MAGNTEATARRVTSRACIEGQQRVADILAPGVVAGHLAAFLGQPRS